MWPFKKGIPTNWRSTGETRWRVLSKCDGYRRVRQQEKWIDFASCRSEWRDAEWSSAHGGGGLIEETRPPIQSDHDEVSP